VRRRCVRSIYQQTRPRIAIKNPDLPTRGLSLRDRLVGRAHRVPPFRHFPEGSPLDFPAGPSQALRVTLTVRVGDDSMSAWALLLSTLCLLLIPRAWAWASAPQPSATSRPEIHGFLRVLEALNRLYCGLWHQLKTPGRAPLPQVGPAILIANHTCGIDHMLLQAASHRLLGFMVAREYYEAPSIHWICKYVGCIPVNRDGRDFSATRAAIRALKEGRVLPIFPEGHIVPASGRRLDEMKPGTAYLAIHAQVPVVPAFICGTPETDEIADSLLTPSRARVMFGEPIDLSDVDPGRAGDKAVQAEVSERFRGALLALQARALSSCENPQS
jgi:1-acyl-sn-glycerol-3-phosphate acyltransferase